MTTTLTEFLDSERKEFDEKFPYGVMSGEDGDLDITDDVVDFLSSHDTRLLEFVREIIKNKKEEIAQGLVYLSDGFPPEKQWEASEGHAEIIIKTITDLLTPPTKV